MAWLSVFSDALRFFPARTRSAIAHALHLKQPSTLFAITSAATAECLLSIITERNEDINSDHVALAHVRIVTSSFLMHHVMQDLQLLEKLSWYYRSESLANVERSAGICQRVLVGPNANLALAEQHEKLLESIDLVVEVLQQFIGMHMEVVDDIQVALASQRAEEIGRAIVTSCRQASAFQHAVSTSPSASRLVSNIENVICSSLNASTIRDYVDQKNASGQLEQFWNQHGSSSSKQSLSPHDIRLTLQILERELLTFSSTKKKLRHVLERDFGRPWVFQRHPARCMGLAAVSVASVKAVSDNSGYLGGTGLLEEKMTMGLDAASAFASNNIIQPITRLYEQVFTVSDTSASAESVAENRAILRKMLIDFTEKNLAGVEGAEKMAEECSMTAVMNIIMQQARHPIRNSISGSLGQAFILQVQKLKCDVEELMLKSKQMIRAQELNLTLIALVPSLLTAAALTYFISTFSLHWRSRNMHLLVSGGQTVRFILSDIQKTLITIESNESIDMHTMGSILSYMRQTGSVHLKICELEEIVNKGLIKAPESVLYRFARDLKLLRSTSTTSSCRRRQICRILQTYDFLQHK